MRIIFCRIMISAIRFISINKQNQRKKDLSPDDEQKSSSGDVFCSCEDIYKF